MPFFPWTMFSHDEWNSTLLLIFNIKNVKAHSLSFIESQIKCTPSVIWDNFLWISNTGKVFHPNLEHIFYKFPPKKSAKELVNVWVISSTTFSGARALFSDTWLPKLHTRHHSPVPAKPAASPLLFLSRPIQRLEPYLTEPAVIPLLSESQSLLLSPRPHSGSPVGVLGLRVTWLSS